jgi:uncharacterized protein YjbI with pentapeptide repeats
MKLSTQSRRGGIKAFLLLWIPVVALSAAMLSCDSDSDDDDDDNNPPEARTWLYEHEFDDDPSLFADPEQIVILDIEPDDSPGEVEHSIRYRHREQGSWLLAVAPDDPYITRVELRDRVGGVMESAEVGEGGVYLDIAPGDYSLTVYHDGAEVPLAGTVAFAYPQTAGDDQTAPADADSGGGGSPIPLDSPTYVALKVVGGDYDGKYLVTAETTVFEDGKSVPVLALKAVSPSADPGAFADRAHLFSFVGQTYNLCNDSTEDNYEPHSWRGDDAGQGFEPFLYACSSAWDIDCPASQSNYPIPGWTEMLGFYPHSQEWAGQIQDTGDGTFSLLTAPFTFGQPCSSPYVAENGYVYFTGFSDGRAPDNLQVDSSFRFFKDGSVIDRRSLQPGEAALYEGTHYSGVAVILSESFSDTALIPLEYVGSVAFGLYTDTTVELFGDTDFTTSLKVVGIDTPDLRLLTRVRSIKLFDSRKRLIATKQCPYCNLANVDLTDQTSLDGVNLTHANLQAVHLNGISLTGADLSYTLLHGANVGNANLEGASLLSAFLNGNSDLNLPAAVLSGAHLKNANLKSANLGGVKFLNGSFYSHSYSSLGCDQDSDNPGFTMGCASAQGATLSAADFSGAYLAGADFSSITATGTSFSNAVLVGAKFTGAKLDWASQGSSRSGFNGAFIGGANFGLATVGGTDFTSAYVDFNPRGSTWLFILNSALTQFPGFDPDDNPLGHQPCVHFGYGDPTTVPASTDQNNLCVNGDSGPCGDATDPSWTSPVTDYDKTRSSRETDDPTACDWHNDLDWSW